MIIDRNGRLFGKVSIIDVLIIVLIFSAGVFFAARYLSTRNTIIGTGGALDDLVIGFSSEEVNNFVVDAIKVGDSAKEYAQYANFGTVIDVETADSITWIADLEGFVNPASKDGYYSSVTVKTRAKGKINDIGFELDGSTYFVGKTVIIQFGKAGFQGRISSVERFEDVEAGLVAKPALEPPNIMANNPANGADAGAGAGAGANDESTSWEAAQ